MDNILARRLEKIEGLLTKLLIDSKIAQRIGDKAYDLANQALIEIRSAEKSTRETKFVNAETYNQMFPPTNYGPEAFTETQEKEETKIDYPFDLRDGAPDLIEFEDEFT